MKTKASLSTTYVALGQARIFQLPYMYLLVLNSRQVDEVIFISRM
jgi:hypothetical protein